MIFYKTSSFGNDFIEIEAGEAAVPPGDRGALVRAICDRQRGVGADGVVFYRRGRQAARAVRPPSPRGTGVPLGDRAERGKWHFEIFNRDGGAAELSGNGMAGLAAVLIQRRAARSPLVLHAAIGPRRIVLVGRQGPFFDLDVEIGLPDFARRDFFPFLEKGAGSYRAAGVEFHPVAVGNPHAVVLCRRLPAMARLAALGGKLEGNPLFPKRVNVEFVQPCGAGRCRVLFFERGVGPTQASSTGSAAIFAVLRRLGLAGERLTVECGSEAIAAIWRQGIFIRNRTRLVCRGEYFS